MSKKYQQAGVNIAAGDQVVDDIKSIAQSTSNVGVITGVGGFGAVFDPRAAGFVDPLIVLATDGVGTKLRLAIDADNLGTIGIDLVAMCVNDLVVQGAKPLAFLDYYATGVLDPQAAASIISGIAQGCRIAGCALVGGETAEMPGMYKPGDFDLAGFAMGAVERGSQLPLALCEGDLLVGLPSSGIHSNGFSLVRKLIEGINLMAECPWDPTNTLVGSLLTPTKIYVDSVLDLANKNLLLAAAHITGGGIVGNLSRIIPHRLMAKIEIPSALPEPFNWLQHRGEISLAEMVEIFNCGIGMILAIRAGDLDQVLRILEDHQESPMILGRIHKRNGDRIVNIKERTV